MIKAIAVDDEPKALSIIKSLVQRIDFLDLITCHVDEKEAIKAINETRPDLLFLDITMPNISGIDLIKALNYKPLIIFTTAHSDFAMKSYELDALDYLLKPFDFDRFLLAVTKAKEKIKQQADHFFVNTGNKLERIDFKDLLYLIADGNYVNYVTKSDKIMVRIGIKKALEDLPESDFIQIHRSTIVALAAIEKYEKHSLYIGDLKLAVSKSYEANLQKRLFNS